jgi:hypothetical protein
MLTRRQGDRPWDMRSGRLISGAGSFLHRRRNDRAEGPGRPTNTEDGVRPRVHTKEGGRRHGSSRLPLEPCPCSALGVQPPRTEGAGSDDQLGSRVRAGRARLAARTGSRLGWELLCKYTGHRGPALRPYRHLGSPRARLGDESERGGRTDRTPAGDPRTSASAGRGRAPPDLRLAGTPDRARGRRRGPGQRPDARHGHRPDAPGEPRPPRQVL